MPTGEAAGQAAQKTQAEQTKKRTDKGPGSVSGNLAFDPELRFSNSGRAVCSIRVAYSERVKDDKTGEWKDGETCFYDIQAWGNLAENICEALQKGDRVVAEGRWEEQQWANEAGEEQSRVVLVARDLGPSMIFKAARVMRPERTAKS